MSLFDLNVLSLEDMKYLDSVLTEEFGPHAMIYHPDDRYCYLATPIKLPFEQGTLIAMGLYGEESQIVLKIKKADDYTYQTNAIEL